MATQIFVNLPVKDLDRSIQFFTHLGYSFNPQFTDHNAACMVISDTIYAMLLTEPFFKGFISKPISDATKSTEVLIALSFNSREEVDQLMQKAIDAGGREHRAPQEESFMYSRSFEDPDGHIWEIFFMDTSAFAQG